MTKPEADILSGSAGLERRQPLRTLVHVLLPIGILAGAVVALHLTGRLGTVGPAVLTAFFTVGKLLILAGAAPDRIGMTTYELALMVFCMDVFVGYVFAFNVHHVYGAGRAGAWLQRLTNYCRYWLAHNPWMRRWAFTGVMLFVMFPLTGTGAPGGSLLGRLVGLRAIPTLVAIALGSALGCVLVAAFAEPLRAWLQDFQHEWWFESIGIAILAIVGIVLWRLGRRLSQASEDLARTETGGRE